MQKRLRNEMKQFLYYITKYLNLLMLEDMCLGSFVHAYKLAGLNGNKSTLWNTRQGYPARIAATAPMLISLALLKGRESTCSTT